MVTVASACAEGSVTLLIALPFRRMVNLLKFPSLTFWRVQILSFSFIQPALWPLYFLRLYKKKTAEFCCSSTKNSLDERVFL